MNEEKSLRGELYVLSLLEVFKFDFFKALLSESLYYEILVIWW